MSEGVLALGPLTGPVTGQSKAFKVFLSASSNDIRGIDKYVGNDPASFYRIIKFFALVLFFSIFGRYRTLYLTTSRTKFGFILDLYAIFVFKLVCNGKVVNHLHGSDFVLFRDRFPLLSLLDWTYMKIDTSIVLCEPMKEQYACYPKMNVTVVPNFSDRDSFPKQAYNPGERSLKLLYLSNLIYSKGILHLVKAVTKIRNSGFDVSLTVAGRFMSDSHMSKGGLVKECERYWSESIKYVGAVDGAAVGDLLLANDIMCLPTFYVTEAQPLAIIEGLAHGMYILTTRHNYNEAFLDCAGNGIIWVESKDDRSIYQGLERLVLDGIDTKVRVENYNFFKKNFSLEAYIEKIDEIL